MSRLAHLWLKKISVTLFFLFIFLICEGAARRHRSKLSTPLVNARASPSPLKTGTISPVKANASLLMWSVISSELALLQYEGLRTVGKTSAREERGNVHLSLLVGHDFHFDLSAEQLQDRLASPPKP